MLGLGTVLRVGIGILCDSFYIQVPFCPEQSFAQVGQKGTSTMSKNSNVLFQLVHFAV
jgi:hypothetical protein